MRIRIFSVLLVGFVLFACEPKADIEQSKDFIRPTVQIIEVYENELINIDSVYYEYENEADFYWNKATYIDKDGNKFKEIIVEFDENRLPIKETVIDELGTASEIYLVKYCPTSHLLLEKIEYRDEIADNNIIKSVKYNFESGKLLSEEVVVYSKDADFVNADGNRIIDMYKLRFLPLAQSRPAGLHRTFFMIENRTRYVTTQLASRFSEKNYEIGSIFSTEFTNFDEKGVPLNYKTTESPVADEHFREAIWFATEFDEKGNLISITGYSDEAKEILSEDALKYFFEYDDKGVFVKAAEYMLNTETNEFDLFHGQTVYNWVNPFIHTIYNYSEADKVAEHKCIHRGVYSITETKIEKYTPEEKIIVIRSASKETDEPRPELELKIKSKTHTKYELKKMK